MEKIRIFSEALSILEKYKDHPLIDYEINYQRERVKYSQAYFEGQFYYVGLSLIEYVNNTRLPYSILVWFI